MTERTSPPPPAAGDPADRRPLLRRRVLDEEVAAGLRVDPRPWGVASWLAPLLALAGTVVAFSLVGRALVAGRTTDTTALELTLSAIAELVLLAAVFLVARPLAARGGGWRPALGLDRVRRVDWRPFALGLVLVWVGRYAVGLVAGGLTGGRALEEASNLRLGSTAVVPVLVLGLLVAVVAPVVEELVFRGLLLRSFMRRMSFWPAAALSTVLFAGFHAYQVRTLVGAVTLVSSIAVLGLAACVLTRVTGRLVPGILVHATFNALALTTAVVLAR